MQGHLLGTSGFSGRESHPLWSTISFPLQIQQKQQCIKDPGRRRTKLPSCLRSPPHASSIRQPRLLPLPRGRPLHCRLYSIIRCTLRRKQRKEKKNVFAVIRNYQLCLCLKRTVVLPNGTLPNVQKPYIEVRGFLDQKLFGCLRERKNHRKTSSLDVWSLYTQWSGEKLAALGASLRPGLCSFPQERLETHALAHEAHLPNHF